MNCGSICHRGMRTTLWSGGGPAWQPREAAAPPLGGQDVAHLLRPMSQAPGVYSQIHLLLLSLPGAQDLCVKETRPFCT